MLLSRIVCSSSRNTSLESLITVIYKGQNSQTFRDLQFMNAKNTNQYSRRTKLLLLMVLQIYGSNILKGMNSLEDGGITKSFTI